MDGDNDDDVDVTPKALALPKSLVILEDEDDDDRGNDGKGKAATPVTNKTVRALRRVENATILILFSQLCAMGFVFRQRVSMLLGRLEGQIGRNRSLGMSAMEWRVDSIRFDFARVVCCE